MRFKRFAIAYDDIIYNPLKNNNEEEAPTTPLKLYLIFLYKQSLEKCRHMIIATKNHEIDSDAD